MDTPNSINNLNEFMNLSIDFMKKKDYNNALKYAALASVSTDYPRADVCCQMGDIYMNRENYEWSKFWFEKAIGNIFLDENGETIDTAFSTTLPMLRLTYVNYKLGNLEVANEYNESVLKINPENPDAIANKETFSKILGNKQT